MRNPTLAIRLPGFLAVAAVAVAVLLAAPPADARGGRHLERLAEHAERLGLAPEQREAIREIVDASADADAELDQARHRAFRRMHELMSQPETDHEAVMEQADVLDDLRARGHRNRLDAVLRIHEVLTPEQREELVRIREEAFARKGRARCAQARDSQCAGAESPADRLRCLADHYDALSERCREGAERLFRDRRHGPPRKGNAGSD